MSFIHLILITAFIDELLNAYLITLHRLLVEIIGRKGK
jgi:hypothetical protein